MPSLRSLKRPILAAALLTAVVLAAVTVWVSRAPARVPAPPPRLTALQCGRLIDVERGTVMRRAVVLVADDRITAVGTGVRTPAGAAVIDLSEATVLPGLIDAHTHLLSNYDHSRADLADDLAFSAMPPARRVLLGAAMAREELAAGFTTVRDLGNSGRGADVALRDAIAEGWVPGPRMVVSTRALSPPGGQFEDTARGERSVVEREYAQISGPEDARRAVRQAVADGADLIKVIVDGRLSTLSAAEVEAIVDEAHRARRKVAAHATSLGAAQIAAAAGVDSIEHGKVLSDEVMRMMAAKRIFLVPTDLPSLVGSGTQDRLTRALGLGVPVAAGSDLYFAVAGKTRGQAAAEMFRAYAQEGMRPLDILRAATLGGAELLGLRDQIGSLAAGKEADLIAVEGDPLADITVLEEVAFVMKAGAVVRDARGPLTPGPSPISHPPCPRERGEPSQKSLLGDVFCKNSPLSRRGVEGRWERGRG